MNDSSGINFTNKLTYNQMLSLIKDKRSQDTLHIDFTWIDMRHLSDYDERRKVIEHNMGYDLVDIIQLHYMSHNRPYWENFIDYCMTVCDTVCFAATSRVHHPDIFMNYEYDLFILGIGLFVEYSDEVYVRCLCSNSKCGGKILEEVKQKYVIESKRFKRLMLHSEPTVSIIMFYVKHGFVMLKKSMNDKNGIVYPVMVCPLRKDNGIEQILNQGERLDHTFARQYRDTWNVMWYKVLWKLEWYFSVPNDI